MYSVISFQTTDLYEGQRYIQNSKERILECVVLWYWVLLFILVEAVFDLFSAGYTNFIFLRNPLENNLLAETQTVTKQGERANARLGWYWKSEYDFA
jgi:hypothetical protein